MKFKSSIPLLKFGLLLILSSAALSYIVSKFLQNHSLTTQKARLGVVNGSKVKTPASTSPASRPVNHAVKQKMVCPPNYMKEVFDAEGPVTRTWEEGADSYEGCVGTLRLRFKNGTERRLVDTRMSDPPPETDYRFIKHFKAEGFFAVEKTQYREVASMELWSEANGTQTPIYCSLPEFSPNHLWFYSYCTDLLAGYSKNNLGLWSLANGKITQAFKIEDTTWGVGSLKWLDDETITFVMLDTDSQGKEVELGKGQVQRRGGAWIFSENRMKKP